MVTAGLVVCVSSVFPDGGRPAQWTVQSVSGLWRIYDKLALLESSMADPPVHSPAASITSTTILLTVAGSVMRTTTTPFATGSWSLNARSSPPRLELELAARSGQRRTTVLSYAGILLKTDSSRALKSSTDMPGLEASALALQRAGADLSVFGDVEQVIERVVDDDGELVELSEEWLSLLEEGLDGRFSMVRVSSFGDGDDAEFVCEVGTPGGLPSRLEDDDQ